MRKSLIFSAWTAAMLAWGPVHADVTVDVSASWHDFAATAAAVDLFGTDGEHVCLLTLSGPSSGTCAVTFPDDAQLFLGYVSLIPCDQSAFLDSNGNVSVFAPNCGIVLEFFNGNGIALNAGETVPYDITLAADAGPGTIAGKISLPPGAQIAQGSVNSISSGNGSASLRANVAISGPNADGSYGYSMPSLTGGGPPSLAFALQLPSGSEANFSLVAPAISTPGQTVPFDVATFTYVTGTVSWNTLQANSGLVHVSGPASGTTPIILAPDGLSGTYDTLLMADALSNPAVSLSTCADPTSFCNPGITTSFFSLDPIDTTGNGGQSISHDFQLPTLFSTFSGTVSVDGATLQGGVGFVSASNSVTGQFTTTSFDYGANGAFDAVVGQGLGLAVVVANASECVAQLNATSSVDLGAAPVQQDFAITVNAALPGSATLTVGLDALAGASQETYDVTGTWQGDPTVAYCNGGSPFVSRHFDGPGLTTLTGLLPGPWTFRNAAFGLGETGGTTFQHEFTTPPQQVTVPAGGTASFTFVPNPPTFTGGLDTTAWQLGTDDLAFLGAATSTNGDGSSSFSNFGTTGSPPGNHLPVELLVGANEPAAPASLSAGATYRIGPTSSSSWYSSANQALPPLTTNQVMPGLDAVQIAGIGTWTMTNLVPVGSQFANAFFSASAGNLQLSGSADLGSSPTMRMKLPAGSYGSGPQVFVVYLDGSGNWVSNTYPIGGEIAPGDALTDTLNSPVLLNRTPAPGTFCPTAGDGTTRINVAFTVASAVQQLQSLTIAGKSVKAGASANATVLLPLGTWPSNVSATQKSGDRTSWDRFYTVPSQMSSSTPLGALVPHGTNPVPVPAAIKPTGTATLSLQVNSCGQVVSNPNAFAKPPRIVAISRNGQTLSLATLGSLDADGDIDFQLGANGTWTLKLNTKTLGTGTFLVTLQGPDTSFWDGIFVVHP